VNLKALAKFPAGSEVTPESLRETGVVRSLRRPIKILSDGELTTALTVRTHRVSPAARAKIEAAGGTVEELTPRPPQPEEKGQPRRPPQPEAEDSMADEEAAPAAEPAPEE
jgi:large subunit ribosomal protein L15